MTALTSDRNTPRAEGDMRAGDVAAAVAIYMGAMVMRDGDGNLTKGQTATGLVGVGVAQERADNSSGAAGAIALKYRPGLWRFENSAAADEITKADIGKLCYAVDDQTVAKTDGGTTRSPAGFVDHIDANGVWVRFDEAVTAAAA